MIDLYEGFLGQAPIELCYFEGLAKWTNAERWKLIQVAEGAGGPPDELSAVIKVETAGTFSPTSANPKSSARGLLQWIDSTAKSVLGMSSYDIPQLNVCAQLDLANTFFKKTLPKGWKQPGDFYRAVQGGGTYHAGSQGYELNKGWDLDKDGTITPAEVAQLAVQVKDAACATGKRIPVTPEECPTGGGEGIFSGLSKLAVPVLVAGAAYWYFTR